MGDGGSRENLPCDWTPSNSLAPGQRIEADDVPADITLQDTREVK